MIAIVATRRNLKYVENNVVPAIYSGSSGRPGIGGKVRSRVDVGLRLSFRTHMRLHETSSTPT
jgi:hypothetical protein